MHLGFRTGLTTNLQLYISVRESHPPILQMICKQKVEGYTELQNMAHMFGEIPSPPPDGSIRQPLEMDAWEFPSSPCRGGATHSKDLPS